MCMCIVHSINLPYFDHKGRDSDEDVHTATSHPGISKSDFDHATRDEDKYTARGDCDHGGKERKDTAITLEAIETHVPGDQGQKEKENGNKKEQITGL